MAGTRPDSMTISLAKDRDRAYRPEIEGLRAVAAILVAVYHIWLGRVSGGVDVFFVVSGFLITTTLLRHVRTQGQVRFGEFWAGLARRLLPASMLVLFVVAAASIVWLPRPLWADTIRQIAASALYVQNWMLAFDSVDYLAQGTSASPVQHYWALSVQGQFYLVWPFLIAVSAWWASRKGGSFRKAVVTGLLLVFFCSFTYSVVATKSNQVFTYFNTFARVWEFSLGALLAAAPSFQLGARTRLVAGWVGLIGIVACGMVFQVSRAFPGYAALWPTGCALLVILAGVSGSRYGADRLLCSRPLVYLGGISYAIYLWHWPVLIFWRWFTLQAPTGVIGGLGILALSIGLAALSTRFVEQPVRRWQAASGGRRSIAKFVAAAAAPVAMVTIAWGAYYAVQRQYDGRRILADDPAYPGARVMDTGIRQAADDRIAPYPGLLAVADDLPELYARGCDRWDPDWHRQNCIFGDLRSTRTIALVGTSRAAHWFPALQTLAEEHGWRIVSYARSVCVFSVETGDIKLRRFCREHNARLLQILLEDRPDIIITTATRGSGPEERVPEGFLERWAQLDAAGIRVIAIRETPWMRFSVPECLAMRGIDDLTGCSQPRSKVIASPSPIETLAKRPANVHFVDMTRYFCDAKYCLPVIGNIIVYWDPSHITAAYSRTLAPMLLREMSPGLPEGWVTRHARGSVGGADPAADAARSESRSVGPSSRLAVAE